MEVQIEKKNETSVSEIVNNQPKDIKARPGVTVVTPDNFDAYVDEKMGIANPDPEKVAKEEKAKLDAKKEKKEEKKEEPEDVEATSGVSEHLPKDKKGKLNERFSELTSARKAAEEKATTESARAKEAADRADALQRERDELKAKYEPVKTDPDPEPQISQFSGVGEYSKALKEWTADNTRREDAKKAETDRRAKEQADTVKVWSERQEAYKAKNPDYEKKIAGSTVKVSDQVRDAIIESDVGPQILEHLADHPEEADKIGQMTVGKALKAIGRLEATLGGEVKETKDAKAEIKTAIAEISKAPAPISPLRNASSPVVSLSGNDAVPANMTYDTWKTLRQAGKIK